MPAKKYENLYKYQNVQKSDFEINPKDKKEIEKLSELIRKKLDDPKTLKKASVIIEEMLKN